MQDNYKEQIRILIDLQGIETTKSEIEGRLAEAPRRINELDSRNAELQRSIETTETELEELKKASRTLEADLKAAQSDEKKKRGRLSSVKSAREHQAVAHELDDMKEKIGQLEGQILSVMEKTEAADKRLAGLKEKYETFRVGMEEEKQKLVEEIAEGEARLPDLTANYEDISGKIRPDLLRHFHMIRERVGGDAVVPVSDAVCRGCFMNIPPQLYNELQRWDGLKNCPYCNKIIYWEEEA